MVVVWAILAVVLWMIGLLAGVAGNQIHVLLLVALVLLTYNSVTGRRAA